MRRAVSAAEEQHQAQSKRRMARNVGSVPLQPGSTVGAYEVVSLLGLGGMGEVYRARDVRLNRDVALKVLPEIFAVDASRVARFEREAQLLASLNHPHIAAIYGVETTVPGTPALILELVEGATLADRLSAGAMPWRMALGFGVQIAGAMEAAHARGVVHRDLKPANIKITNDGQVKVLDFGIAKVIASEDVDPIDPAASNATTVTGTMRRRDRGHTRLHEPGAGARRTCRQARRHLGVRLRPL